MKHSFFILLLIATLLISCEKKIEIHSENSEEKIAVEAIFSDNLFISYVRLSKTKCIYESILNHPKITDADVKVYDETDGSVIDFTYNASKGKYVCAENGIAGHQYRLEVKAENQTITAHQTMTGAITLNGILSVKEENSDKYYLKMRFDDDPNQVDYYLFIMFPMDPALESRFTVLSDLNYDRNTNTLPIRDELFNEGEDWQILMFHVDVRNYNYLKVILRAMKSLVNGAHPFYGLSLGNPQNTVEGKEAIGYFIASPVAVSPIHIGN